LSPIGRNNNILCLRLGNMNQRLQNIHGLHPVHHAATTLLCSDYFLITKEQTPCLTANVAINSFALNVLTSN
jgi:hypothetical protein